jgi:hypothetical protein
MKLHIAIDDVQRSEMQLAKQLRLLAEDHAAEHDVYHQAHARAQKCVDHVERLKPFVERYQARAIDADDGDSPGVLDALRRKTSELLADAEPTGVLLLHDLRDVYVTAQRAEIDWTILKQGASAVHDQDLVAVVSHCQPEADVTGKWLRTRIKAGSAQVLATG